MAVRILRGDDPRNHWHSACFCAGARRKTRTGGTITNKELIADARKAERRVRSTLDITVADLVRELADALEAASVRPFVEGGPG